MTAFRQTLCLDFDGVIHRYASKWRGATVVQDPPMPGAYEFIVAALQKFDVCVLSSRSHEPGGREAMALWMVEHFGGQVSADRHSWHPAGLGLADCVKFPLHKPPAFVTVDDRALTFTGRWPSLDELQGFLPWNKEGLTADVKVPEPGTEERDFWLRAVEQHGFDLINDGDMIYIVTDDQVLKLMASAREQGRRDVLGLPPKELK